MAAKAAETIEITATRLRYLEEIEGESSALLDRKKALADAKTISRRSAAAARKGGDRIEELAAEVKTLGEDRGEGVPPDGDEVEATANLAGAAVEFKRLVGVRDRDKKRTSEARDSYNGQLERLQNLLSAGEGGLIQFPADDATGDQADQAAASAATAATNGEAPPTWRVLPISVLNPKRWKDSPLIAGRKTESKGLTDAKIKALADKGFATCGDVDDWISDEDNEGHNIADIVGKAQAGRFDEILDDLADILPEDD